MEGAMTRFAENVRNFNTCVQASQIPYPEFNQFSKSNFFTAVYQNRWAIDDCYWRYPVEQTEKTAASQRVATRALQTLRFSPGFGKVKRGLTDQ